MPNQPEYHQHEMDVAADTNYPPVIPPTFTTERLRVWELVVNCGCEPDDTRQYPRRVFIAGLKYDVADWPGVAVSCSVNTMEDIPKDVRPFDNYIDWIQVADAVRSVGLGRELIAALHERLGALTVSGTSPSGHALEAYYERIVGVN